MIYLDNGATTISKPQSVAQAVYQVLSSGKYGNPSRGAYNAAVNASELVYATRQKVARLFNVPSSSLVVFTKNVTEALNTVIKGYLTPGDHVMMTVYDHNSVLRPIYQLAKRGVKNSCVPLNPETNLVDLNKLEAMIRPETKMMICTHASNVIGNLIDIKKVAEICHRHDILLVVDVAQTAGVIPIDMQELGIDILCFTGHKSLYGPEGIGGICFSRSIDIEPLISGGSGIDSYNHSMPNRLPEKLEGGTLNVPGIAGLGAGIDYLLSRGVKKQGEKAIKLADMFAHQINHNSNIKIYTNLAAPHVGTIGLNFRGINSVDISDYLNDYGIATRAGAHCAPLIHQALGTTTQGITRFSFCSFNTEEEVRQASRVINHLAKIVGEDSGR
ncbi:cysteine desulfurase [Limosilactobacillus reuteri]|uniref:cysteine desulfurase n=1 Tax=Limosilactobacillus reuteri TaxID=1598 RepID=A0A317GK97_LIMRT|nr:aminotransferase class V-fold PLP-dependent enzyme [Limosilactobacillus reuteri]MCH5384269.1 aminotransferase class V-fold PLP-dependent enzyme [Limosilactobacillus reuteri]PWT49005.1 cysteine desulfurase [Limosilactobacillus reuteri]PWT53738.1 cysteine desulfurase [Limosilactobacillus reuteri]PWT64252.1 cysteine desulfurase [Limosilactobacillus reuteri]